MSTSRRHLLALGTSPLWLSACGGGASTAAAAPAPSAPAPAPAAESPNGWAGVGQATGGFGARAENIFDVTDRASLNLALAAGTAPKIIRIRALIDLGPGGAEAFRDDAYSFGAFERTYDPGVWGRDDPAGPLEDARRRSAKRQADAITVRIPSNTTVLGAAPGAGFKNGTLVLDKVSNVVIRHLRFSDAYDHFPAWEPRDNVHGEWNSAYDNVSLSGAERVWVDHCHFDDGDRPDALEPVSFGRRVQHHDGLLDITNGSDLVTVSWCRFQSHDKTMLIGSSDTSTVDDGKLRVTLHHNHFHRCKERTPRVRFGRVHVAGNLFTAEQAEDLGYSLGVGLQSRLVAEANVWELPPGIGAGQLINRLKGSAILERENRLNGQPVDLLAAWRAAHPGDTLSADVGWRPSETYDTAFLQAVDVNRLAEQIRAGAGPNPV